MSCCPILARVIDTYEELRSFSRLNGEQVVTFSVFRAKGASEVSVAEVINAAWTRSAPSTPKSTINMVDDTVFFTYGNYEAAIHTLLEGALLAVIVVLDLPAQLARHADFRHRPAALAPSRPSG